MNNQIDLIVGADGSVTVTQSSAEVVVTAPSTSVAVSASGPPGPAGINASIIDGTWTYDTNETIAFPGNGRIRSSADAMVAAIAHLDVDGRDLSRVIRALSTSDVISMQAEADASIWGRYRITSVVDMGAWTQLGLAPVEEQGSLAKNQRIFVRFVLDNGSTSSIEHHNLLGLGDDDHTQYALLAISAARPVNPRAGTLWVTDAP